MQAAVKRTPGIPWTARAAGALVALLGVANATFGVLGLATDLVRLDTGAAGGLLLLGAATIAVSVPVWRGSATGVTAALAVFTLLLILQLGDVASASGSDNPAPRLAVLGVVILALGAARLHLRRTYRR